MSLYHIDLFISYAHIDNQALATGTSGWISRLHASLDTLLSMRLGKRVRIWRDDKLQGNDRFAEEIVEQFDSTAVLVSIVSPRYLQSHWCTREIEEFCKRSEHSLFIENKARIFKVMKAPVDSQEPLPSTIQELLGYDFFIIDDGVPLELDDQYGPQFGQDFNRKVNKLAFEIAELLKELDKPKDNENSPAPIATDKKPVVYLAECAFDVKQTREDLETHLHCLGYQVLPDRHMPRDEQPYADSVDALLERCDLAVHLVGSQYGAIPDGPSERSIAEVQNHLAAEKSRNSNLSRLIWLGGKLTSTDVKQQRFIESIQSDAQAQAGADVLIGDVEELKSAIVSELKELENPVANPVLETTESAETNSSSDSNIYLICTENDRKATVPLRKHLKAKGYSVSLPAFKGDAAEVRSVNQHLLTHCDKVIIFYGSGDEAWKRSIDTELRKLPAHLQGQPAPIALTYLAEPLTCDKEDMIDMDEEGIVNATEHLSTDELDALLDSARLNIS